MRKLSLLLVLLAALLVVPAAMSLASAEALILTRDPGVNQEESAGNPGPGEAQDEGLIPAAPNRVLTIPSEQDERLITGRLPDFAVRAEPAPRFRFRRVDDGMLRLDTQRGQIVFCAPRGGAWTCDSVSEKRAALEQENTRLKRQVVQLREELAKLRIQPEVTKPATQPVSPTSNNTGTNSFTNENIIRARAAVSDVLRRVIKVIDDFKNEVMRKVHLDGSNFKA
jgi:hypothetical protein